MNRNKAFKFRLYPNKEQQVLLAKTFGCVRFVYNRMLADKINHYEGTGQALQTTPAQYKKAFPWLKEVDSLALCNAQLHLQAAYKNFFQNEKTGFPKFKSKHRGSNSYTTNLVNGNITLADGFLKLPKLSKIKIKQHRQIPQGYQLKSVTVSRMPSGNYFASLLYEYNMEITAKVPTDVLGLDFSMGQLYVDSNGGNPSYPQPYRRAQEQLAKEQRKLSRRKKGGANYRRQKRKVARLHEHIANQRKDFLHKQSRQIANAWDMVCVEDLNMRGMSQALNFGKSVSDNGWGMFVQMLEYKLEEQGKHFVKIDRWLPSSKACSSCGAVKDALPLSIRTYRCDCGYICDRDLNAALNIEQMGQHLCAELFSNRGTHGDRLVNISPWGERSQEAPASNANWH